MSNSILFIINPISGNGKGKLIEPEILTYFKNKNRAIKIIFAEYAGHAKQIALDELANHHDAIIACGGDGTINEVAQSLVNTSTPLGILPIGSGNGLASNLHIPKDISKALAVIEEQFVLQMDVGKLNDQYFFSNVGIGMDAQVIHRYAEEKKRNFSGYMKATIWSFLNYKSKAITLETEEQKLSTDQYFFALISNSNEAGYGISFTPYAKWNDGKLDLLLVKKLNLFELLQFGICVITKKIDQMKKSITLQPKWIKIKSEEKSFKAQIDGEAVFIDSNVIEVSILPKALRILVPKQ